MSKLPEIFTYEGHQVRTVTVDGDPWFVATDVCAVLDIGNSRQALSYLDADEKGVTTNDTPGGDQQLSVVSEPGLYSLILRSRKPEARDFKRWVTHEVLPQIRQTGSYSVEAQREVPGNYAAALREAADQADRADRAEAREAELEPSAQAWDTLASAHGDYSIREGAFILNRDPAISTGQNRLFATLRELGLLDKRNIPYARHEAHVTLRARHYTNPRSGEQETSYQARLTAQGLKYVHRHLGGTQPLRLDTQLSLVNGGAA